MLAWYLAAQIGPFPATRHLFDASSSILGLKVVSCSHFQGGGTVFFSKVGSVRRHVGLHHREHLLTLINTPQHAQDTGSMKAELWYRVWDEWCKTACNKSQTWPSHAAFDSPTNTVLFSISMISCLCPCSFIFRVLRCSIMLKSQAR